MPSTHPNITKLILNPAAKPLPFDHPPIEPWIGNLTRPSYTPYRYALRALRWPTDMPRRSIAPWWHPDIEVHYDRRTVVPVTHDLVHSVFAGAEAAAAACERGRPDAWR
jgi:hypothetical protein